MLAYSKAYKDFCLDISQNVIVNEIRDAFQRDFSASENRTFRNSLGAAGESASSKRLEWINREELDLIEGIQSI